MEYANTSTTLVPYVPLPSPEDIVAAFVEDAGMDEDELQIENVVAGDTGTWVFDLRCPAHGSLIRVSSCLDSEPDARKLLDYLTLRVSEFEPTNASEDSPEEPNTAESKQAVLEYLAETKYVVQTQTVLIGEDNHAWDIEYGIHICLARFSTPDSAGVIGFYAEGTNMSFADEVCSYLEFEDSEFPSAIA